MLMQEAIANAKLVVYYNNGDPQSLHEAIGNSTGFPQIVPWQISGYWVEEWFPQMHTFATSDNGAFAFSAI